MSNMWGFDLDMTAVRLMCRIEGSWQEVAAEKIEGADIEERLMALVARIDDDAPVMLFLPRDQILCTEVAISSDISAKADIEAALVGATPYPLDELDLDWEMVAPDRALVAAIAFETLDEAVAFAEVRGVRVGGFSSLALGDDFPRLPDFTGHNILFDDGSEDFDSGPPVTFASARVVSKPRPDAPSLAPAAPDAEPVLSVEDTAPVVELKAPVAPPLDPGAPMAGPTSAPRVRTDIAAGAVSDQVASLTPPHFKVHSGPSHWKIGAVMAAALLITVGVAALVWQLLPLGPGESGVPLSDSSEQIAQDPEPTVDNAPDTATALVPEAEPVEPVEPEVETAMVPDPVETTDAPDVEPALAAPELAETTEVETPETIETEQAEVTEPETQAVPDLPLPVFLASTPALTLPEEDAATRLAALSPVALTSLSVLDPVERIVPGLPFIDLGLPLEPTPAALAGLATEAPDLAPSPAALGGEDVQIASIDRADTSIAVIALPSASGFVTGELPSVENSTADALARLPVPEETTPQATEPVALPQEQDNGLPVPTALARGLTDRSPAARPSTLVARIERQRFGGYTKAELSEFRPPKRPASEQAVALAERTEAAEASALAVAASPDPRARPQDFQEVVTAARAQTEAEQVTASVDFRTPDTNAAIAAALQTETEPKPKPQRAAPQPQVSIPSSASVARQATIENAIRLNKVNLVGVYGTAADRRAMVRLPSGRFVKVKVGDRVDGGTVAQIKDDELLYKKGSRTISLSLPKG